MKSDNSDSLLTEVFHGDDLDTVRQATLKCGLAEVRRQRGRRRLVRIGGVAALLLAAAAVSIYTLDVLHRRADKLNQFSSAAGMPNPEPSKGVKIITDEQLFALFPGRPMALVGKPGQQQLVFLDQSETETNAVTQ